MKKHKNKAIIVLAITILLVVIAILSTKNVKKVDNIAQITDLQTLMAMEYGELGDDDKKTESEYVEFSAFFTKNIDEDEYAERVRGTCKKVGEEDTLYLELNVLTKGHLKDGIITLNADNNFTWTTAIVDDNTIVDGDYIGETDTIKLNNPVQNGSQKLFWGTIKNKIGNNINNYSKLNSVTLAGTYVDDEGNETPISKTVNVTVDWYGEVTSSLATRTQLYEKNDIITNKSAGTTSLSFSLTSTETKKQLLLKENVVSATIPELNGFKPISVTVSDDNVNYEYDEETGILTIKRESVVDKTGAVKTTLSRTNKYNVTVVYSFEAYDEADENSVTLEIPATGYYTAYNNSNSEFNNPIQSNIANGIIAVEYSNPKGTVYNFGAKVGNYVNSKWVMDTYIKSRQVILKEKPLSIYNSNEVQEDDYYTVKWSFFSGTEGDIQAVTMSETKSINTDKFLDVENNYYEMGEYISNIGIYFQGAESTLGEEGYIEVYNDETDDLLHTFTKADWAKYTEENPYKYENSVKHIRIKTSKANQNSTLAVYHIKEINDEKLTETFTKDEFDKLNNVYTYLTGEVTLGAGGTKGTMDKIGIANYEETTSYATISTVPTKISTQETSKGQKIYIYTVANQYNQMQWKNGQFLVKLPEDIISAKVNSITVDDSNVEILGYDVYKEDGAYFIKIITANENESIYRITIDCDLTANPASVTKTEKMTLYAYNENCSNYESRTIDIYDVNENGNKEEKVAIEADTIDIIAPSTIVTSETVTNYDDEGSITISPNIAEVKKEQRTADINVNLINNYDSTISETKVLGVIPCAGNTYIINKEDLGSEFSVIMSNTGIQIPEELKDIVTVYYSENKDATKDLTDEANGWTKNPQNWGNVKRYLIDFGDYIIPAKTSYVFTYAVQIPEGINPNKVSYSAHAIYFSLDTEEGKLQTQTEPSKLGIRIVRKYGINITKYKENTNRVVPKVIYKLSEIDENNNEISSKLITTNTDGKLITGDLHVNRIYLLKEIKATEDYILNDDEIKFKVTEDGQGNLVAEVISEDKFANTPVIENDTLIAKVENEPKYNLVITKTDKETGVLLKNIKFKIEETGKLYTTNTNGQITVGNLEQNKTYTLKEVKADGYYLENDIVFKLVKDEQGNLKIESENANFVNAKIVNTEQEDAITVSVSIQNEKIPTYNLQILKVEENFDEENIENLKPLAGGKFLLTSIDKKESQVYTTDENGYITIPNLYQYVEGKYITGEYILQETKAPSGYANNAEEITFEVSKNSEQELEAQIVNQDSLTTVRNVFVDGNTVKLVIQDKPLFKLTKIDSETGEVLANAKFIIFEIDENGREIDYAKDVNGNYVGEKDENGEYTVTTDLSGVITLPLRGGIYKAVEVGFPEGYEEESKDEIFKVDDGSEEEEVVTDNSNIIEIYTIEDLVELSNNTNAGETYAGKTVKLMNNLDFKDANSYKDATDTSFGDLNGDGTEDLEGIMAELTDEAGCGFTPIGKEDGYCFSGTFDGQGYEIRNLYVNTTNKTAGLFGFLNNGSIKRIGVTGFIKSGDEWDSIAGGIAGSINKSEITNSYNLAVIKGNGRIGGIVGRSRNNSSISDCYNIANLSGASFCGGIVGEGWNSSINNCYNTGNQSGSDVGGIAGDANNLIIDSCYNVGTLNGRTFVGGIVGELDEGSISRCYNTGDINSERSVTGSDSWSYAAGIIGRIWESGDVNNCYNIGNISSSSSGHSSSGGIVGCVVKENTSRITNCYNLGDLNSKDSNAIYKSTAGGIVASNANVYNCYYSNTIAISGEIIFREGTEAEDYFMTSEEFYNTINADGVWNYRRSNYPVLAQVVPTYITESTEITIENTIKKFEITTEVEGDIGGSISGEDEEPYETVIINNANIQSIYMKPDDGYGITNITVNGEPIDYVVEEDGSYTIPAGYFEKMQEDKHIIVTYTPLEQILTINKQDENNSATLIEGAKFKVEQIDERTEVTNEIGRLVDNGGTYSEINTEIEITEGLGEITNNGTYYFEESDGRYISNNTGIASSTANSYIQIDLTEKTGTYQAVVNAQISSESADKGYATISQTIDTPAYNNSTGRFIYISGTGTSAITANNYESEILEGGNIYYLHLGYYKDSSVNSGDDIFTVNSIKVYEANCTSYNFEESDGKYVSNNQGKDNTVANSYIPIDLSSRTGKYNLKVNAEISSQSGDYGYVTITNTTTAPSYGTSSGRLVRISGEQVAKDYTTILEGGSIYYVHLGYYKDSSTSSGSDTFTVNSIELSLNTDDFYAGEHTTNEYGQIRAAVPVGKYKITEIQAPSGYVLDTEPKTVEVGPNKENSITITNKQQTQLTVHHYLKQSDGTYTTQKVAEDEVNTGNIGEKYTTQPRVDLVGLTLEKVDGNYKIPNNATGTYTEDAIEVIYYYEAKPIELKINHYIEGTNDSLADKKTENYDSKITFNEDGTYNVTAEGSYIVNTNEDYNNLLKDYILTKIESSVEPELSVDDTLEFTQNAELTYYYTLKDHVITTEVKAHEEQRTNTISNVKEIIEVDGGTITGKYTGTYKEENKIQFVESVDHKQDSTTQIVADPDQNYKVKQITLLSTNEKTESIIYGEGAIKNPEITYTEDEEGTVTLTTFKTVTEGKHIIVEFKPVQGTVIVHHYIEGTGEEYGTEAVKVPSKEQGKVIEDETKQDYIGEKYATKQSENVATIYELVSTSGQTSGEYASEEKHVYYYYNLKDYKYTVHYFYDGVEAKEQAYEKTATYGEQINSYDTDRVTEGYVFEKVKTLDEKGNPTKELPLTITENENNNVINVYYRTQYKITTDVIEHTEEYKDGTTKENVKGGEISGELTKENQNPYELIFKGDMPQNGIKITPTKTTEEEYEIVKIIVKNNKEDETGEVINLEKLETQEDGSVILPVEYLADEEKGMQSDKHIEVEFRKKSKVIIKHLEEGTQNVLYTTPEGKDYEEIPGYEGQAFETARKAIEYYMTSDLGITDENNNSIEKYTKITIDENKNADGTMYADTLTIIYWYERIPAGIIVKHIEINEQDKKDGLTLQSGTLLDEELLDGFVSLNEETQRNIYSEESGEVENEKYKNYISVDGPQNTDENLIIVGKDENTKTAIYKEDATVEVRYYYEKQHKLTTEVKPHTETIDGTEKSVDGGTISKEYITDAEGNKEETTYELINSRGYNKKQIEMTPDAGYRIKEITIKETGEKGNINETKYTRADFEEDENHKIVLKSGMQDEQIENAETEAYFKDVQEDIHVIVEFERIPAKVIVEYRDEYTGEIIPNVDTDTIEKFVGDNYETNPKDIENYVLVEEKYPNNSKGTMTEEDITVVYWYAKQFKITTDVIEHTEVDNDGNVSKQKGGSITAEDEDPYELVVRGNSNTLNIEIEPSSGYEIKEIQINGIVVDYINDESIVKEGKKLKIPSGYFNNMQENKHITVEYKRILAIVKVQYLEEGTEKVLYTTPEGKEYQEINGYVNDKYSTSPKQIENYELVQEKYPNNSEGTMTEQEIIVKYYYKKALFNMKIEKEIEKVIVNGQQTNNFENNKLVKVAVEYKEIADTTIEISYKIKVTNTEKVAGTAIIEEYIPEGFEFVKDKSDENWKEENGKFVLQTEEIKPKQTKEYTVTLKWNPSEENKGQKENIAKIANTANKPNYEETTKQDNEDKAIVEIELQKTIQDIIDDVKDGKTEDVVKDIITNVKTGDKIIMYVMTIIIAGSVIIVMKMRNKK